MKRKQHITAFYLETLLMIAVFVSIILVLTRVFGSARAQSAKAKNLTVAVTLAQNAAEAVSASKSPQDLLEFLNAEGNAILQEDAAAGEALVTAVYDADMNPVPIPAEILAAAGQNPGTSAGTAAAGQDPGTIADTAAAGQKGEDGSAVFLQVEQGPAGTGTELAAELLRTGDLIVETAWTPARGEDAASPDEEGTPVLLSENDENGADGHMVNAVITVFNGHTGEAVFSVETAVWLPEK